MFDYQTLKVIWWIFVGVLLIGFALMDGFDFGVGMLLPFLGKTDTERRIMLNSIGPTWEGNQVWFVTAGGALFAAWPLVYAAAFSGFYIALMVLLFALFFRPVGFDYRSKLENPVWRSAWDWGLFVGGFVPPLIFGVAFGNLFLGVPFHYDDTMRLEYTGTFFQLLNPFALLTGVLSVAMMAMHGSTFLQVKAGDAVGERAHNSAIIAAIVTIIAFVVGGIWVAFGIDGYRIVSMPDANSAFMPIVKTVERVRGAWFDNHARWPVTWIFPLLTVVGAALCIYFTTKKRAMCAFLSSGLSVAMVILTAGMALFPFIMPSSLAPNSSLTAWDAVASQKSLGIMFWVVVVMLPIIILYTSWVYRVMRGKVDEAHIRDNEHSAY